MINARTISRSLPVWPAVWLLSLAGSQAVLAQTCDLAGTPATTLRTPLIDGAWSAPPGLPAPEGQPPAPGDGMVPAPVTPGHLGPPTLIPSVTHTPGGIGSPSYDLPFNPASQWAPGEFGPSHQSPPPPSTPGFDPGQLPGPRDFRPPPASIVNIQPGGGIVGWAPETRWGGQTTADWGLYKHDAKRAFDFGQGMPGQTSQDGPWQTRPGATPTFDLYGQRRSPRKGPGIMTIAPY